MASVETAAPGRSADQESARRAAAKLKPPRCPVSRPLDEQLRAAKAMNARLHALSRRVQTIGERQPSSGKIRTGSGRLRPRTFTGRPHADGPKRLARADYTHTEAQLLCMTTETRSLLARLSHVHHRPPLIAAKRPAWQTSVGHEAPTARNRRLESERIALENYRMYLRLQAVRPSKETSAAKLRADFAAHTAYSAKCSRLRPSKKQPPKASGAGRRAGPAGARVVAAPTGVTAAGTDDALQPEAAGEGGSDAAAASTPQPASAGRAFEAVAG